MNKRAAAAVCGALALLCLGIFAGRYSALRGGAVITAESGFVALEAVSYTDPDHTAADWRININTATLDELCELPGIGPAIGGRVVEYREANGDFETAEEIMAVKGIGESLYHKIREYITCGD